MGVRRRITILLAVILGGTVIVAIAAPREEPADDPTPRTIATTPTGADVRAVVRGTLPRDKVVRAKVGELVELTVTSDVPESVAIEDFGLTEGVERGAPARFSFLADREGRFAVTLTLGETKTVGRIVVRK
jgi:Rieske Fe-S protein